MMAEILLMLTTVLWTIILLTKGESQLQVRSYCTKQSQQIHLKCQFDSVLNVRHAYYGVSSGSGSDCRYRPGDCHRLDDKGHRQCDGKKDCVYNIGAMKMKAGVMHGWSKECESLTNKAASNYYQIVYNCIPLRDIHTICKVSKLEEQQGYIKSPNFPDYHVFKQNCTLKLDLSRFKINQKIKFTILEMDLFEQTLLQIVDPLGKSWQDNKRKRKSNVFTSISNVVDVNYLLKNENHIGMSKGFWLRYEASPQVIMERQVIINSAKPNCSRHATQTLLNNKLSSSDKNKDVQKLASNEATYKIVVTLSVLITVLVLLLVVVSASFATRKMRGQGQVHRNINTNNQVGRDNACASFTRLAHCSACPSSGPYHTYSHNDSPKIPSMETSPSSACRRPLLYLNSSSVTSTPARKADSLTKSAYCDKRLSNPSLSVSVQNDLVPSDNYVSEV